MTYVLVNTCCRIVKRGPEIPTSGRDIDSDHRWRKLRAVNSKIQDAENEPIRRQSNTTIANGHTIRTQGGSAQQILADIGR